MKWLASTRIRICLAFCAALLAVSGLAASAGASRVQVGHLIVSLDARFSPHRLPRDRPVPVSISVSGLLTTDDGSPLPRLRGIELALATAGSRLETKGLPICKRRSLLSATPRLGLKLCADALVGHGGLGAKVDIPGQATFDLRASILAFNGAPRGGRAVVWLLGFSPDPPASFLMPILIRHRPGPLGTTLTGVLPHSLGPWPHVSAFHIVFHRHFYFHGAAHSYLSASCPVPPRFTGGLVPFARARYYFNAAPTATTTVTRSCEVR
ncbi:MAG TPA: hypothetical protein VG518_08115 [Solirubrobacterales bacterium]|nr:hypothetical protein [Solirubrobacterales bacterium]